MDRSECASPARNLSGVGSPAGGWRRPWLVAGWRSMAMAAMALVTCIALALLAGCGKMEESPASAEGLPPDPVMAPPPPPALPPPPAMAEPPPMTAPPPTGSAGPGVGMPSAPGTTCLQESLAPFPWPRVPEPTAMRLIHRDELKPAPATLGDVLQLLQSAVAAAGYPRPPVLGAGCNGFALILEGERIRMDGRRIGFIDLDQSGALSIGAILRQLFTAEPGLYRMIAVVVSTDRPQRSGESMSARELRAMAAAGSSGLPAPLAALDFTPGYEVRALVYEFMKEAAEVGQVPPTGRVSAVTHLKQAGLLPAGAR